MPYRVGVPGIDDRAHHRTAGVASTCRPSIYDCRQPPVALSTFVDAHLSRIRDARVMDAGAGAGPYVPVVAARAAELVAVDLATIRLSQIDATEAHQVCGDVQALPFRNGSFDVVMAMHMLYHVPDIAAAAREFRRVLRDGGVLYALTNSTSAQAEFAELIRRNGCDPSAGGDFGALRFSNENGVELLRAGFDHISVVELGPSLLVVTDPEQLVDEVERNRYLLEPGLRPGVAWRAFVHDVRVDAGRLIARDGDFRIGERHGLFTCW